MAVGGALGAVARHAAFQMVGRIAPSTFGIFGYPLGTLIVNVAGSLLMGVAAAILLSGANDQSVLPRTFFMTGLLGGFTTFSTFSLDAIGLLRVKAYGAALGYIGLSVSLSLIAFVCGFALLSLIARAVS